MGLRMPVRCRGSRVVHCMALEDTEKSGLVFCSKRLGGVFGVLVVYSHRCNLPS